MISELPDFLLGQHYRDGGRDWRFTTLEQVTVRLDLPLSDVISFRDRNGTEWARFTKNKLTIRAKYSWDGCSPKKRFAMLWLGTPDPHCTRLASLVHDVLYQFIATDHFPLSRKQCDAAFYDVMYLQRFLLAGMFHQAVRTFGGLYVANNSASGVWSQVIIPTLPKSQTDTAA